MWDEMRMDKKISRLRRQIARAPRNSRGRRKSSESLRQELMELADAWRNTQRSQRELADPLERLLNPRQRIVARSIVVSGKDGVIAEFPSPRPRLT